MKMEEVGLIALLLAVGIVTGFVAWTYVGPKLSSLTTSSTTTA